MTSLEKQKAEYYVAVGIKKGDSPEQIMDKILEYIKKDDKMQFNLEFMTDEQRISPKFRMELYKLKPYTLNAEYTSDKELWFPAELKHDEEFAFEYLKNELRSFRVRPFVDMGYYSSLLSLIGAFKDEIPDFWQKFADNFQNSDLNFVFIMHRCYCPTATTQQERDENKAAFRKALETFSTETLVAQAQKYGVECVKFLPKDFKDFENILAGGIEYDGFQTFGLLEGEEILKYEHLIPKAVRQTRKKETTFYGGLGSYLGSLVDDGKWWNYPILKALVEDDGLWNEILSDKSFANGNESWVKQIQNKMISLRDSQKAKVDEFYERIKPIEKKNETKVEVSESPENSKNGSGEGRNGK